MLTKIHPSYSFVVFLVGVIFGDIFTLATRQIFFFSTFWLIFAGIALLITFFRPILPMLILSFVSGFICINFRASFDLAGQDYFKNLVGETVTITGTISEDPDTSETRTALRLNNLHLGGSDDGAVPGSLYVQMSVSRDLQRSDIVTLTGKLSSGFGTFSGTIYRPSLKNITRPDPGDVFLTVRDWFAGSIKTYLSDEEAALGLGYLLGMRSSLPSGLDEKLRIVGLTHIIVASGANLSILIGFSRKWFGKISRFTGLFVSIFLVLGYVGVVGLAPSMVRAGLVSILTLLAWYVGREFRPWRILLIVAALTLLYSPMYLIDLGWLLSFASFAGIMIFGPALTEFFFGKQGTEKTTDPDDAKDEQLAENVDPTAAENSKPENPAQETPNFLAATLLETISASLLCIPILLYFFGTLSLVSLLANLLILPTISAAMALTFATGAFMFLPPVAAIFGKLSALLLEYHLSVINFFGAQSLFLVEIPANDPRVFLLYLPVTLPFLAKKLYNMYKCSKKSPSAPNLRC